MAQNTITNLSWIFIFVLSIFIGCQDPIVVGNDLLDEERLNIGVTDTFDLSSYTINGERVVTHRPGIDSRTYLLGNLNDNVFGKISAEIYLKCQLSTSTPNYHLEQLIKYDSLVLVLAYDSTATYARSIAAQKVEVFQLNQTFSELDTFYSDTNLTFGSPPIGEVTTVIRPKDSISIVDHVTRKIVKQGPQLRIRFNETFGKALLDNENAAKNDTAFAELFKGVYIKSTSLDNTPFLYGFNFSDDARNTTNSVNKLIMYYNVSSGDTTLRKTYEYLINAATINRYVHDRTGSQVENFILNPSFGDSLTFLQSMGGVKSVIKFNDLNKISKRLINKAELDIYVADLPDQNGFYPPPPQLLASRKNSSGTLALIPDIVQLINSNVNFEPVFGGSLNSTAQIKKYTLNITNHIKSALKDNTYNSDLYIGILTESETPHRAVLYGAGHSQYPMKLKITYTKN